MKLILLVDDVPFPDEIVIHFLENAQQVLLFMLVANSSLFPEERHVYICSQFLLDRCIEYFYRDFASDNRLISMTVAQTNLDWYTVAFSVQE